MDKGKGEGEIGKTVIKIINFKKIVRCIKGHTPHL